MNAYELADKVDFGNWDWADEIAKMLRQQAGELEAMLPNMMALNHIVKTQRDRIAELEAEVKQYEKFIAIEHLTKRKDTE